MNQEIPNISLETGTTAFVAGGILLFLLSGCVLCFWYGYKYLIKLWVEDSLAKEMPFGKYLQAFISGNVFEKIKGNLYFSARNYFNWSFAFLVFGTFYVSNYDSVYGFLHEYFTQVFANS